MTLFGILSSTGAVPPDELTRANGFRTGPAAMSSGGGQLKLCCKEADWTPSVTWRTRCQSTTSGSLCMCDWESDACLVASADGFTPTKSNIDCLAPSTLLAAMRCKCCQGFSCLSS